MMETTPIGVGDRVRVYLSGESWLSRGWFEGTVVRVDRYTEHRSFHWVELDADIVAVGGARTNLVSVLNPKHIQRNQAETDGRT
jgi:hypothetical protein